MTGVTAGENWYGCTSQDTWTLLSGGGGGAWGSITGTLSSQTDLASALDGKQAALTNYSTVSGLTGYPSTFPPTTTGLALLGAGKTFTTGLQDFSGATGKIPSSAGFTASASSMLGFDSTAGGVHVWHGAADHTLGTAAFSVSSAFQAAISGAPGTWPSFGGAALLNVGTTTGTVAAGDDSRLSDARTPTAHAASHQNGGSDEIATATPAANAIPKAGASGTLAAGWLPPAAGSALGGVNSKDCSGTGHLQKINTDGSITCSANAGGGGSATSYALIFDGSTTTLADGSTISWSCGSGSGAQCTGNWTVPTGVNWLTVEGWGAGSGGGPSTAASSRAGAGGSGGGYIRKQCAVTPGPAVAIAVGIGGAGGISGAANGGAGGNPSFGSCVTAYGSAAASDSRTSPIPGGPQGNAAPGGPFLSGAGALVSVASGTPCAAQAAAAPSAAIVELGGCGPGGIVTSGAGLAGGKAIGGGAGGGDGAFTNTAFGVHGTSVYGGNGGDGGWYDSGASTYHACTDGVAPGGGAGGAGEESSGGANHDGCNGARGEVRVYYTR